MPQKDVELQWKWPASPPTLCDPFNRCANAGGQSHFSVETNPQKMPRLQQRDVPYFVGSSSGIPPRFPMAMVDSTCWFLLNQPLAQFWCCLKAWLNVSNIFRGSCLLEPTKPGFLQPMVPRWLPGHQMVAWLRTWEPTIGVLLVCFGRKIDGPGLPGGLMIYQGPFVSPKRTPMEPTLNLKPAIYGKFIPLAHAPWLPWLPTRFARAETAPRKGQGYAQQALGLIFPRGTLVRQGHRTLEPPSRARGCEERMARWLPGH